MSVKSDFHKRLRSAIASDAITPAFQPIVKLATRQVSSFEVLARWHDPDLGPIPPTRFIPVLESLDLIAPMTDRLIQQACTAAREWPGSFRLTFNISPRHFQDGAMPSLLENAVRVSRFPIERTQIEITETAFVENIEVARITMDRLRAHKVHVLLDDFGVGYSNFARLQMLHFDKIKIDASFIRALETSQGSRKIVAAMIGLGQSLGVPMIAEGIEDARQEAVLKKLGCDYGQGWLYSAAMPAKDVPPLLNKFGQATWETRATDLSTNQRLAHFDAIYQIAPVGLCSVDSELNIVKANERWTSLIGTTVEDSIGRSLMAIDPKLAQTATKCLSDARAGEYVSQRSYTPTGGKRLGLTVIATQDEIGQIVGLTIMFDVSRDAKVGRETG